MSSRVEAELKPWCPFCGMDVGRPTEKAQRKLNEFPGGTCDCGAVYVADATGHNVGSAMVECLVNACNEEWDLAWELVPEDDYLTGRLDDYDEVSHQVCPKRNLDGRAVRGVLYFVRLHREMAELVERFEQRKKQEERVLTGPVTRGGAAIPELEPERDPKRPKKRANKRLVKTLALDLDIDSLVDLSFDDRRTLRFLQRLLYEPDPAVRYQIAWTIGQVSARVSTREPGPVADLLHRLFEASADSASTSWGMVEAIGAIVANRPDIYGAFTRHLFNYLNDPVTREAVMWGLAEIAAVRPDLIRKTPFYSLFSILGHEDAVMRGLTALMLGRIQAGEAAFQIMGLQNDNSEITIYDQGRPVTTTVGLLAAEALENIHKGESDGK